ncbi:DUF5317 domain-containing protein [Acidiferrimicrobium sp. IK]|uniref:DUF5317 domain-containing protein n=1 Tax=Acidiferrimicrobium sp. IK TaxID=2871700 RepID=UPI0021CB7BFA|nr:DUF5317 domain-containing protein [Acidiferrimicrobium sp. IK]MCU4185855.1 DUF5317 domain-containing protein [Acidiferrimicrobium sp. IK]
MLVTVVAVAIGLGAGLALGGRPARARRVRALGLVVPGAGLQLLASHVGLGSPLGLRGAGPFLDVAGLVCLAAFLWCNRGLAGAAVGAFGVGANAAVITLNGGMPVDPAALVSAGAARPGLAQGVDYGLLHHRQAAGDVLTWLDDRWPLALGHQVLSAGDVLLVVGVAVAALDWLRPPRLAAISPRLAAVSPGLAAVSSGLAGFGSRVAGFGSRLAVGTVRPPADGDRPPASGRVGQVAWAEVSARSVPAGETAVGERPAVGEWAVAGQRSVVRGGTLVGGRAVVERGGGGPFGTGVEAPGSLARQQAAAAPVLQVPVEPVEDGPGDRLLFPAPAGETPPGGAQPLVTELDHGSLAEIAGEDVYRSRFKWNPEPEFPEAFEHRPGDRQPVPGHAGGDRPPAAVGEVDLDAAAGQGGHGEQLDP